MPLGGAQIGHQGAPLDCKRSFFSVRVNMGERSELFWLRAIACLAEVIAGVDFDFVLLKVHQKFPKKVQIDRNFLEIKYNTAMLQKGNFPRNCAKVL